MKNHSNFWVLVLILIQNIGFGQGLLWEIKDPNNELKTSYLYGSFHAQDQRLFNFDSIVYQKIQECEVFANEIAFDSINPFEIATIATSTRSISLDLDSNEINILNSKCVELSMPFMAIEYLKPFFIYQTFFTSDMPQDQDIALDKYLLEYAKSENKSCRGLERAKDQFQILSDLSDKNGIEILKDYLNDTSFQEHLEEYETYIQLYLKQNIEGLLDESIAADNFDILITTLNGRNHTMMESILSVSKEKSLFSVVGAAHLAGPQGLIQLLSNQGLEVKAIPFNFNN